MEAPPPRELEGATPYSLRLEAAKSARNAIDGVGAQPPGDKTPYKTHQGAFVAHGPRTGWYVEVSPRGVRTGAGFYDTDAPQLAALRSAMADDRTGQALAEILEDLAAGPFEIGGDRLKTTPRGYPADHPRIDLLRHRSLVASHLIGFEPVIHTAELLDLVRDDWRALRPLVEWCAEHGRT